MTKFTLSLPHYRLRVELARKRRAVADPFFLTLSELKNIRSGNKFSRFARHFLERVNIKTILGGNITLMVLASSLIVPQNTTSISEAESIVLPATVSLTTQVNIHYPVENVRLNQGFSYFHPGVDLGGNKGDVIKPIENGTVESTDYSRFGYGNAVVIAHKDGIKSRYAHLSRIDVRPGDEVTTDTQVGLMGSTGRSTGNHLHLEIREADGKPLNPIAVLGPISNK